MVGVEPCHERRRLGKAGGVGIEHDAQQVLGGGTDAQDPVGLRCPAGGQALWTAEA